MPKKVFIPFDTPVFSSINSNHPLLASLVQQNYQDIIFVRAKQSLINDCATAMYQAAAFSEYLSTTLCPQEKDFEMEASIANFVLSRDLKSQMLFPSDIDLAFFHTAPVHINQTNWFLHIESISQIFQPQMSQGLPPNKPLRDLVAFHAVRAMLESQRCRAIFSNLKFTKQQVAAVFNSDIIDSKMHYVPLGPWFAPEEEEVARICAEHRSTRDEVKILFTNSWHDGPDSFLLRGGLDVLLGFLKVADACPNLQLIIRSAIPQAQIGAELDSTLRSHPRIKLITERVSDNDMLTLFADCDIFALNAAGLHSISVLRAMYCGAACVVSDVPGYSEYLVHGESGFVIEGRSRQVNRVDQSCGWVYDDYPDFLANPYNYEQSDKMAAVLMGLYNNPNLRHALGKGARERVLSRHRFTVWQAGFENIMRASLSPGGPSCTQLGGEITPLLI